MAHVAASLSRVYLVYFFEEAFKTPTAYLCVPWLVIRVCEVPIDTPHKSTRARRCRGHGEGWPWLEPDGQCRNTDPAVELRSWEGLCKTL